MLAMVKKEENNLLLTRCQSGQSLELFGFAGSLTSDTEDVVRMALHKESDGELWLGEAS